MDILDIKISDKALLQKAAEQLAAQANLTLDAAHELVTEQARAHNQQADERQAERYYTEKAEREAQERAAKHAAELERRAQADAARSILHSLLENQAAQTDTWQQNATAAANEFQQKVKNTAAIMHAALAAKGYLNELRRQYPDLVTDGVGEAD